MFKRFYLSLVALLGLCGAVAVGNYTMTQGAGTTFGSVLIGGTVHYAQQLLCDLTTPAQCASVSAGGAVKVDGSAVTQPVSSATLSTAANQTSQITQETAINTVLGLQADSVCGTATGTCTLQALVKFLNTAATSATPAGTNLIGDVNVRQGGAALSTTNGIYSNLLQGNAVLSATNGLYFNTLQGNAVISATNGTFANILQGNAALSITNPVFNRPVATATGGASTTGNIGANNTTAVVIKAGAGTLYGVQVYGIGSAPAYLKIYNATSATCGSGTPVKRLMIPAASTAANGAGSNIDFGSAGVDFSTGITYCLTTGITDADTTAPAASTFLVNIDWK